MHDPSKPFDLRLLVADGEIERLARKAQLVQAVLTIIRGWFACGSPRAAEGDTASYEEWDKLIRQPIMWIKPMVADWLPLVDPLDSVKRAYDQDPETTKLNAILSAWESEFGNQPTSVHDAITLLASCLSQSEVHEFFYQIECGRPDSYE